MISGMRVARRSGVGVTRLEGCRIPMELGLGYITGSCSRGGRPG